MSRRRLILRTITSLNRLFRRRRFGRGISGTAASRKFCRHLLNRHLGKIEATQIILAWRSLVWRCGLGASHFLSLIERRRRIGRNQERNLPAGATYRRGKVQA